MRILLVNHYAAPPSEPGGTRHFTLARELMALGHQVTIAASSFDHLGRGNRLPDGIAARAEVLDGVPFLWLNTPRYAGNGPGRLWNMLVFARAVRRQLPRYLDPAPEVVVGSSPHLFGARAALDLARRAGVPFVLELRDVWPQSLVDVMDVPAWHPLIWHMERVERQLYRGSAHIISLLPAVAGRVSSRGGADTPITWVSNGIDLGLVPRVQAPAGRPPFTFMYAGAHGITNALDVLVDAAALLEVRERVLGLEPAQRAQVVLVGTGPEKARLQARVQAEGIGNLTFRAPVPKREIYGLLAQADAFLVSSRDSSLWDHGISFNKIFDFMAMARPVVAGLAAANNPIQEADAGLTVAPGSAAAMADGMLRLMAAGPEARWAMALRGRAAVEARFDFRILARRFEGALLAALAGAPGRAHAS
jgi:glycosyltransferase involved in cell wall biosynthesis